MEARLRGAGLLLGLSAAVLFAMDCGTSVSGGAANFGARIDAGVDAGGGGGGGGGLDAGVLRSDGGVEMDAGTVSCSGLVAPVPGQPKSFSAPFESGVGCGPGTSDVAGNLLLTQTAPTGLRGLYLTGQGNLLATSGAPNNPIPDLDSYAGIVASSNGTWLEAFRDNGASLGKLYEQGTLVPVQQAPYPGGGLVVVLQDTGSSALHLQRLSPALTVVWTQTLTTGWTPLAVGADPRGRVLVIFDGSQRFAPGTLAGQWFQADGAPGTVFEAWEANPGGKFELSPRAGGGLFLRRRDISLTTPWVWVRAFESEATHGTPPPSWLVERPRTRLYLAAGGQAYWVVPDPSAPDTNTPCAQTVELLSATGQACGGAIFRMDGNSCETSNLRIGADGTVIQQQPMPAQGCANMGCACVWHWWPGLLKVQR